MRRLLTRAAAAAALSVLAVACGSSDNSTGAAPAGTTANTGGGATSAPAATTSAAGGGSEAEIEIEGFNYTVPASVSPGQTIKVVNKDGPEHSVTSGKDQSQFDTDVDGGGGTATFTAPNAAGTYDIICKYHSSMHGTLVVK